MVIKQHHRLLLILFIDFIHFSSSSLNKFKSETTRAKKPSAESPILRNNAKLIQVNEPIEQRARVEGSSHFLDGNYTGTTTM